MEIELTQKPTGFKVIRQQSIKVIATMPCPLKVPFRELFNLFLENYNTINPCQPIFCPKQNDCTNPEFDRQLLKATDENELPDIYLTSSYNILFDKSFNAKFIKTGVLSGYIDEVQREHIPETVLNALEKFNIGCLAFSSWGVAQDYSVSGIWKKVSSWAEIMEPAFLNQITVHGCHGKAGNTALLLFLQQQCGDEAIASFARNVIDMRHFALMIKRMDSIDTKRTLLNVMPDVAASHIPSWKSVERLHFAEGCPLNPMILMVKMSRPEACMPIINFFHSFAFKRMLQSNGYLMPTELKWSNNYILPIFEHLAAEGYAKVSTDIEKIYQANLRHEEIDKRLK